MELDKEKLTSIKHLSKYVKKEVILEQLQKYETIKINYVDIVKVRHQSIEAVNDCKTLYYATLNFSSIPEEIINVNFLSNLSMVGLENLTDNNYICFFDTQKHELVKISVDCIESIETDNKYILINNINIERIICQEKLIKFNVEYINSLLPNVNKYKLYSVLSTHLEKAFNELDEDEF